VPSKSPLTDRTKVDYYYRQVGAMELERESFVSHWMELSQYIDPRRGRFLFDDRNKGNKRHASIMNSVATQALRTAESGIFAGIMSPSRPWFKLEPINAELAKVKSVQEWTHKVEDLMRTVFLESNLYEMAPIAIREAVQFGTAAMSHVDDFDDVCRFYTHTVGSYFIGLDHRGEVNRFAIRKELTVSQIVEKFGRQDNGEIDWTNISTTVKNHWDRGEYDNWYRIVQYIEPNPDFKEDSSEVQYKKFTSTWFEYGSEQRVDVTSNDKILKKGGFDYFPVHVIRWAVTGEDIYGTNCPGMVALGDIKGLQIMEKRKAMAVDKLVNPPLIGSNVMRDVNINALPGGVNIFDGDGQHEALTTIYQVDPRLNEMRQDIAAQEARIGQAFYTDLFLAITAMQGIQPRNQLELSERNAERLLMLGPTLERIQQDFLSSIVEITFSQMAEAGILPEPPEELEGVELTVRFISSLAQAQRAMDVTGIERVAMFAASMAQVKPDVLEKFNSDLAFDEYVRLTGAIPGLAFDQQYVDGVRQQRMEMQMQAEQAQLEHTQSESVKNIASAIPQEASSE